MLYENTDDIVVQHNCLYFDLTENEMPREILPYCMSESASKWEIETNNFDARFTFAELRQRNITSEQLHRWSAPIDISENYQFYLEQLSIGHGSSMMERQLFYNCSSFTFGPQCQYILDSNRPYSSLNEFIRNYYYHQNFDELRSSTCYTHLQCNRGPLPSCLDWSEICDGKFDCLDGGQDEEHCWQLEISECKDGEYRCDNGECIPNTFVNDGNNNFECRDRSDEYGTRSLIFQYEQTLPTFQNEDVICSWRKNLKPFTSSCITQHHINIEQAILSNRLDSMISEDCFLAVRCLLKIPTDNNLVCSDICENENCIGMIEFFCPHVFFYYPLVPIAFGRVYFVYTLQYMTTWANRKPIPPEYICYNGELCGEFDSNMTSLLFEGKICRRLEDFPVPINPFERDWYSSYIRFVYSQYGHCNQLTHHENSLICNRSTMYQCKNSSQCIPNSYVGDGIRDCVHKDDEEQTTIDEVCRIDRTNTFFRCETDNKCIHRKQVEDGECNCKLDEHGICNDENLKLNYNKRKITYSTTCDGFVDLLPIMINGQNHTDETECQLWPCNNTYTRCDGLWNCFNGADEVDCNRSSSIQCPPYHHICVSPLTGQLICLPIAKANDGVIDCLGGIDESTLCPLTNRLNKQFYCGNNVSGTCIPQWYVCNGVRDCENGDDERFCDSPKNTIKTQDSHTLLKKSTSNQMISQLSHCHRGFPVRVVLDLDRNLSRTTCFCPPSYYGDHCQYQNERVSLTLQFNVPLRSRQTLFKLVISLIDDSVERVIHSYQQLSYLYTRDQNTKSNLYLLYSTRPKDPRKQYAVHIDIYEMLTLNYRGSLSIPVAFPFLPVNRLAVKLNLPQMTDNVLTCNDSICMNGRCIRYTNNQSHIIFCQCHPGWSGRYCNIPQRCMCSSDSLCAGITANNRPICVCPLNKFGSRCLLTNTVCQHNACQNEGLCVPSDEYSASSDPYTCICQKGFSGKRCEVPETKIILTFDSKLNLPWRSLGIFHFIHLVNHTTFIQDKHPKIICANQTSMISYDPFVFHIALFELWMGQYYSIVNHKVNDQSSSIVRVINPSDRCQSITELFNTNIVQMPLIQRIKYYHIPCQNYSLNLSCFFDDVHMCLCENFGDQRLANCFPFNHYTDIDNLDIDYDTIESQCLTDDSSTVPLTSSTTRSTSSTVRSTSSIPPRDSGMSSISVCEYLFILLFYLYIH